jgi:hypothetical protein
MASGVWHWGDALSGKVKLNDEKKREVLNTYCMVKRTLVHGNETRRAAMNLGVAPTGRQRGTI